MEMPEINTENAVESLAGIGALNWGLDSAGNFNLVTELLGSGNAEIAYLAFGAAGAVALLERFEVTDLYGG